MFNCLMLRSILVINFYIVVVESQKYGLYHFPDKENLFECITEYVKFFRNHAGISEDFVNEIVDVFNSHTYTTEEFDFGMSSVITYLTEDFSVLYDNRILKRQIEDLIKKALLYCRLEDKSFSSKNISDDLMIREVLPHFAEERADYGEILDYVLVNWPSLLPGTVRMRSTRAILRSYVNDVLKIFERFDFTRLMISMDGSISEDDIDQEIRRLWIRRSELFFDNRNPGMPYIDHIYTRNYPIPHTHGHIYQFVSLSDENFNERNPPATQENLREILNLHPVVYPEDSQENDPFYNYYDFGMRSSQYYLESHLSQFYRSIFFILELRARGIATDEDDTFQWSIPINVLPERIQAIVHDDDAYRDYLLERSYNEVLVWNSPNWAHRSNVLRSRRTREIDLVMLFWERIKLKTGQKNSNNTTTTTETSSTTAKYYDMVKTGAIPKSGQYSTRDDESYDNSLSSTCTRCSNLEKTKNQNNEQQMQIKNYGYYHGYIMFNNDYLEEEEALSHSKVIKSAFLDIMHKGNYDFQ